MANFKNLGFENGTVDGWTKGGGAWGGGAAPQPDPYLPGGARYVASSAEVSVTSAQTDSHTDNHLSTVYDGAHSVLINGAGANSSVSVLSQQIDDFTGTSISFAFAAVLEKSHESGEADGFSITLTDTTTGETLYTVSYDSATVDNKFTLSSAGWYYQDWKKVTVDTAGHSGHDLTLSVLAYDCSLGGHAGYVYFDGFNIPSGKITGTVFHDYDASGTLDAKEPDLAGWTVYVDSDGNGVRGDDEASAVTDSHGRYVLTAVPIGTADIRVDVPTATWEAWTAQPVSVTVTADATTAGIDLGVIGGATPFDDTLHGFGRASETINGLGGNDRIAGRGGDDTITGGSGDDLLRGGRGDNQLDGGAGSDRVVGGDGSDMLTGGAGADVLIGRLGADVFVFADGFGHDRVTDFHHADGDKIEFAVAGVAGMADLVLTQHGQSTIVTLASGGHDAIVLRGVLASALTDDDFVFASPSAAAFGSDSATASSAWHGTPILHADLPTDTGLVALA